MRVHKRGNLYASTSERKDPTKYLSPWIVECSCGDKVEKPTSQEAFYYQNEHAMQHSGVVEVTTTVEAA